MNTTKILILGGYGQTGRLLARLLLQETGASLILAGRNKEKAEQLARQLNQAFPGKRVEVIQVDVADAQSLPEHLAGVDLLLVASSTARYARAVAQAARLAKVDYLDVQFSQGKYRALKSLAGEIEQAGRCFITEAGFHPGLPSALVRYVARYFDRLETANVGSVIKADWRDLELSPSTAEEMVEELKGFELLFYQNGVWKKARGGGMMDYRYFEFGYGFGKQYAVPMMFEEMRALPEMFPSLQEAGFFVGGFNWFVDWLAMPIIMLAITLWPSKATKPMARLMLWGLRKFSKPPFGVILKVEAGGEYQGHPRKVEVSLYHEDGYLFTAIPVVACLLQYLDGSARKPGLWMMGHLVEPERLMVDMQRMGIAITEKV